MTEKSTMNDEKALLAMLRDAVNRWEDLPLYIEGRSIEIKSVAEDLGVCRFKPLVYSRRSQRQGVIPGTEGPRMAIHKLLVQFLKARGIESSYLAFFQDFALVRLLRVPPIEIIVKAALVGTPLTAYKDISAVPTRSGAFLTAGLHHDPYVRFDWRNRYPDKDEVMPAGLADFFIDTKQAGETALAAFTSLQAFFGRLSLDLLDMVFTMTQDGAILTSELSPETVRLRRKADGASYDADLWRKGEEPEVIFARLEELRELLTAAL